MEKRGNLKKIIIIAAIAALVISAAVTVLLLVLNKPKGYLNISVKDIVGDVTVENNGDVYKAYPNMHLTDGFAMTTASESYSHMMLDDDKYSKLDELSRAKFESIGSNGKTTSIFLEYGQMTNEITRPLGPDEEYLLATPNAVLSVRGTIYITKVKIDENGDVITEIFTFGGRVSVHRVLPDGTAVDEEIDVPAGFKMIIKKDDNNTYFIEEVDDNPGDNIDPIDPTKLDDDILLIAYDAAVNGHQLYCAPEILAAEIERRGIDTTKYISYHTGKPLVIAGAGETSAPEETGEPEETTVTGEEETETEAPETEPEETTTEADETTLPPEETTVSDDETTEPPVTTVTTTAPETTVETTEETTEKTKKTKKTTEETTEETTAEETTEETTAKTTVPESEDETTTTTTPYVYHGPTTSSSSGKCKTHQFSSDSVHDFWYQNFNNSMFECLIYGVCEKCGERVFLDDVDVAAIGGGTMPEVLSTDYTLSSGEELTFSYYRMEASETWTVFGKISEHTFDVKGGTYAYGSSSLPFTASKQTLSDGTNLYVSIPAKDNSDVTAYAYISDFSSSGSGVVWSFDFIDQSFRVTEPHTTHTYSSYTDYWIMSGEGIYDCYLFGTCDVCEERALKAIRCYDAGEVTYDSSASDFVTTYEGVTYKKSTGTPASSVSQTVAYIENDSCLHDFGVSGGTYYQSDNNLPFSYVIYDTSDVTYIIVDIPCSKGCESSVAIWVYNPASENGKQVWEFDLFGVNYKFITTPHEHQYVMQGQSGDYYDYEENWYRLSSGSSAVYCDLTAHCVAVEGCSNVKTYAYGSNYSTRTINYDSENDKYYFTDENGIYHECASSAILSTTN